MDNILNIFELYLDADNKKVNSFNTKVSSKMNVKIETNKPKDEILWIEKMEDTLPYLENILRSPTRLIINEEEVVKIEKIKKVTVESIKHLSKNASFIDDIDENGDVQPGKLLNVFKEETFNTYENRFIYTLIQRMLMVIRKEKNKILKGKNVTAQEYKKIDYNGNSYNGKNRVDMSLVISSTTESSGKEEEFKNNMNRISTLEKNVTALTLTSTYQSLVQGKVIPISPPLKKNNVILKNVNFQYAAKLWDYIINEMDRRTKGDVDVNKKEYNEKGKSKKYMDETFLLDYLILQCVENPEIKERHSKEIIERLIANIVEKIIDVNESVSEEQLKNLVSKQYIVVKYKKQVTNKQIQDIFKKHISKYVAHVTEGEKKL